MTGIYAGFIVVAALFLAGVIRACRRIPDQPRFEDRPARGRHHHRSILHPDGVRRGEAITVQDLKAVRPDCGVDDQWATDLHTIADELAVDLGELATVRLLPIPGRRT